MVLGNALWQERFLFAVNISSAPYQVFNFHFQRTGNPFQNPQSRLFHSLFQSGKVRALYLRMIGQHLLGPSFCLAQLPDSVAHANANIGCHPLSMALR